jgi:hypothetical protein
MRSDIEKIVLTERGYTLIYFVTNQYVKDKTRSQFEDQLTRKHGVQVRILDRNWILKCVFEHNRQPLAVETLRMDVPTHKSSLMGPKDRAKTEQLQATEERISDKSRYSGVEYQLVEDCLQAAVLTRNLERPRTEVDGQFVRAERLAKKIGVPQQQLRVAYQQAWTAYWWFEDWAEFIRFYDVAEPLALSSFQSDDVELAANLWQLLYAGCSSGKIEPKASGLDKRREALRSAVVEVQQDAATRFVPNSQPAAKRAGISKRVTWHTFRHTFSTLLMENEEDVKTVQSLMRHANVSITMNIYTHAVDRKKRSAQAKVVEMVLPKKQLIEGACSSSQPD